MRRNLLLIGAVLLLFCNTVSDTLAQQQWNDEWMATRPNKNYKKGLPVFNPTIVPKGKVDKLEMPGGANFFGVLNSRDQDTNGKLVHSIVAGSFKKSMVLKLSIVANRGRLAGAKLDMFDSAPSEIQVAFLGWSIGTLPVINPGTDDWSRNPSVVSRDIFTSWAGNTVWRSQLFRFVLDRDLSYISVSIAGLNHKNASYVAFGMSIELVESDDGFPQDIPIDREVPSTAIEPFSEEFDGSFNPNNWERLKGGPYLSDGALVMYKGAFAVSQWMRVPEGALVEIERDASVEATIDHVKWSITYTGVPPFGMIYGSGCATSFIDTIPHGNPCDSASISFPDNVWIHERITYNPLTGIFVYYKDGVKILTRFVGIPIDGDVSGTPSGTPRPSVSIFMHSGKPWDINNQLIGFLGTVTE
ncbi:MAG: hypothetical protein A3C84_02565 [Candidatus Ryanbacteria bacterium RIFCSPHIGHO2_02_FULL_48_12]|uniref:Uncharacterized protein n=1 Tax=Candidatus Ryanbacteria bacterium RIFCSPHIGHO2_01_FULL_48_27 TaxID=1802115 RepID=A0A1G2G4T3_9BACT|nr:MAG: hypothetical protein A2756_01040 [Candidatus Ryanbacteria bacterium RIFCSPHIGHO2_01_FULL_48_27]OGZ48995.1 MAG: hypothetical protein A3C84_02565 [Candidatus Ryanbacteria bacterium RIFCSPHIGHO2_02_FULL_48_12]